MIFVSSKHVHYKMEDDPATDIIRRDKHSFLQKVLDDEFSPS